MPSQMTDNMDVHYEKYKEYFEDNETTYLKIVKDILRTKGEKRRQFEKIFTLVRPEFLNTKTPSYNDLFNGSSGYVKDSIKSQRSRLKKLGVLDTDGLFTDWFFAEYMRRYDKIRATKDRLIAIKKDSSFFEDHTVELEYDYVNTMEVIRKTPSTQYHLPSLTPKKLDYFDTHQIQIVKMNHVGSNPVVQLPLSYHYRCGKCGCEADLAFDVKSIPCEEGDCSGGMVRVKSQDVIRPAYASRVVTDDLNSISIISLTEIPQGEFIGAVFVCRNKADYYLFMIATEQIEPTSSTITLTPDRHAIWQIIDQIDQQHETRIGKHIHGMDWYKAAILLAYLANRKGRVSTNCLIVGDPGVGKTSTPRFYMATLTAQHKTVAATQLSGPGLHGSTMQIKVGDTTITVPEPGFFSRYELACIDELLENLHLLPQLKGALASNTISKEVAANRTQTPKYATAIATSNVIPSVIREQIKWMNKWDEEENSATAWGVSEHPAKDAMMEEWGLRGLEWRTGMTFADIDRYPLIFFVQDPSDGISDYDLGGEDNEIDDLKLAKTLYDPDINEYFSFCGRIHVDWKSHTSKIIKLVGELREKDKIHSKKRLGQNITLMLQLSAQINGRADLTDEDFEFVRELWSKTCEWIDVSKLSHNGDGSAYSAQGWTIETVKKEIHTLMTSQEFKGSQKYYMTQKGFSLIAGKLEDMGAPRGLIDSTIERYRSNPSQ